MYFKGFREARTSVIMDSEKQNLDSNPTAGLLRNSFFSAVSWASSLVFMVLLILSARYLGDESYGQFAFAFSLISLLEVITDLGIKEYVLRESARKKRQTSTLIGNALTVKVFLSLFTIILLIIIASVLPIRQDVRVIIYLFTFSMVFKSFKLLFRSVFIGYEQFKLEAFFVSLDRFIVLILCGSVLILGLGLVPFALVFMAASFINLIIIILFFQKYIGNLNMVWDFSFARKLIVGSLPFGMTAAAFMIYFRVDSVMLSILQNDVEVGWYNAAYRIIEGLIVIPTIIYYVLFPRLSALHEMAKDSVVEISQRACKYIIALSLPITFLGILTAKPFMLMVYGEAYINAVNAWKILLLGVTFMFLWSIFVVLLNSTNRPQIPFYGVITGSITNIILNVFLIPRYGYIGASVSTVLAEIVLFGFLSVSLLRCGYKLHLIKNAVKPIIASVLSGGIILMFVKLNAILSIFIGVSTYSLALIFLRFFDSQEMIYFHKIKSSLSNSIFIITEKRIK